MNPLLPNERPSHTSKFLLPRTPTPLVAVQVTELHFETASALKVEEVSTRAVQQRQGFIGSAGKIDK
jgi:hypothetical protein